MTGGSITEGPPSPGFGHISGSTPLHDGDAKDEWGTIAHTMVLCGLAENSGLPVDLVEILIRHGDEEILTDLAAREDLTTSQVEELAGTGSLLVVTTLVNCGRMPLPPELLDDEDSLRTLAQWNQIPQDHLARFVMPSWPPTWTTTSEQVRRATRTHPCRCCEY